MFRICKITRSIGLFSSTGLHFNTMTHLARILSLSVQPVSLSGLKTWLVFLLSFFVLSACQSTGGIREHAMQARFQPDRANYVFTQGTGQISGQAYINIGGKLRYASNGRVSLVPATAYAKERMRAIYGSGNIASKPVRFKGQDPQYRSFARHHTANEKGEFVFRNVAPGDYFITTGVVWRESGGPVTGKFKRVALKKRISLSAGEKVSVTLSGSP